jgi:ubiquitin carboxyl-terminal hydrolase 8
MYFNGEPIQGWDCPNCKQKRTAVKKLDISKLPPILVVHFKRFYADQDCISYRKKQNYVNFPLIDLDMAPFVAPSERKNLMQGRRNAFYNLYAVSNHYGSMESGHYTAFCKSAVAKK